MPTARQAFRVGQETRRLATEMKQAQQTIQTIIAETLESAQGPGPALESGRTACGDASNLRAPLQRFPRAVDLSSCPRNKTGLWHTHPSQDELDDPQLSIPDMGLVVYEGVDVHAVVGTRSGEVMVAPEDREQLRAAFNEAIGVSGATSTDDIIRAAVSGEIDPEAASQRVRGQLGSLFERFPTNVQVANRQQAVQALPAHAPIRACMHGHTSGPDAGRLRQRSRSCSNGIRAAANGTGINLRELIVSQTVGTVVGSLANDLIVQRVLGLE